MVGALNFIWIFHILIINSVYLHIHKNEINNIKLALDGFGSFFIFSEFFDNNSLSSWHQGYFAYNLIIDHILWGKWCFSQFNQKKYENIQLLKKMRTFFRNASPLRHKSDEQIERCLKTKYIYTQHKNKLRCARVTKNRRSHNASV